MNSDRLTQEFTGRSRPRARPRKQRDGARPINSDSLGGRLRKRRLQLGWTQAYLGERCCTTQAVIQKIENQLSLRPRIVPRIAKELGVTEPWLHFGISGNKHAEDVEEFVELLVKMTPEQRKMARSVIRVLCAEVV